MKPILATIIFILLSFQTCIADVDSELKEARGRWIEAFNNRSSDIHSQYIKSGGLFLNDQLYVDRAEIAGQLANINSTIQDVEVLRTLKTSNKRYFEIGSYDVVGEIDDKIIYATVWLKVSGSENGPQWVKEFDVLYPNNGGNTDTSSLDAAIKKWDKWVHKKSALQFTKRMYVDDAVYFTKGYPNLGRRAIEREYGGYVEYAGFYLRMSPKGKVIFQPGRAFDIGSYKTPWGRGNYVRFWKQQPDESWRINFEAD
jgi:hypothetical protein